MKKLYLWLLVAASPFSWAQSIDETVVTASPIAQTQEELATSINLIDQGELARRVASNLGEALDGQLGVSNSTFGPGVGNPVIRGQSGKRIEILNDGMRVTDVSDTSADHAVAAEIGHIHQVEVIRGPATLRYGPGAIGGVVNLVERIPGEELQQGLSGNLSAIYNDNSSAGTFAGDVSYGFDGFGIDASIIERDSDDVSIPGLADHEADDPDETTDGYIANSDSESSSFALGAHGNSNNIEWGIEYKSLDYQYGLPPGGHGHHHEEEGHDEDEDEHHDEDDDHGDEHGEEEVFVRLDMEQQDFQSHLRFIDPFSGIDSIEIDLSRTEYEHTEIEIEEGEAEIGTFFSSDSTELSAEAVFSLGAWSSYAGLSLSQEDFLAEGEEAFVPASETSNTGLYWVGRQDLENLTFELGARLDNQSIDTAGISSIDDSAVNLSASVLYPVDDQAQIGFIVTRAERAPSAEELLAEGEHIATNTYEIGDLDLDTEVSTNLELTFRYQGIFDTQTSIFYSDFDTYLYLHDTELLFNHDLEEGGAVGLAACSDAAGFDDPEELEEAVECFQYRQDGANFFGVETEITVPLNEELSVRIWADSVRAELDNSGDVPRMPPTRVGGTLVYETGNWYSSLAFTKAGDQDRPGENQEVTEGYFKLDAYFGYSLENLDLFARLNNVTDEEIRNSTSYLREIAPEPGRSVMFGLRYNF